MKGSGAAVYDRARLGEVNSPLQSQVVTATLNPLFGSHDDLLVPLIELANPVADVPRLVDLTPFRSGLAPRSGDGAAFSCPRPMAGFDDLTAASLTSRCQWPTTTGDGARGDPSPNPSGLETPTPTATATPLHLLDRRVRRHR
jgi:hypothetical protein